MKQIICMKWGPMYSSDYVNRLYSMVARHTQPPFTLYCLTDRPEGIRPEVVIRPCPTVDIPPPMSWGGWRKVSLWAPDVVGLTGELLFLDLDIIITGSMDEFFSYPSASDYVVMRNYTTPDRRIGNTSVFRFKVGSHPDVLERLLAAPLEMRKQYSNSQTFISNTISSMDFWPDGWIKQFKVHCLHPWPLRLFLQPRQYKDAKIVVCTGHPTPDELVSGSWDAPWYKKIYKRTPPVRWVRDAWR
jgi:hypothetical protein